MEDPHCRKMTTGDTPNVFTMLVWSTIENARRMMTEPHNRVIRKICKPYDPLIIALGK
jgi:hypothetical protein